jgi:hypothetical protein
MAVSRVSYARDHTALDLLHSADDITRFPDIAIGFPNALLG